MNSASDKTNPADLASDKSSNFTTQQVLAELVRGHEDWLMERILFYAKRQYYARYTSSLKEPWRISITGLSASILETLKSRKNLELTPDEDYTQDPAAAFGLIEAKRHRQRGVSLSMFMGLMKYYRQTYQDLIAASKLTAAQRAYARTWVDRFFDRVEIAFCNAWVTLADKERLLELQAANRFITNEKNKYLTVFESIASPVILLDSDLGIENLNQAAAQLFVSQTTPGSYYYRAAQNGIIDGLDGKDRPRVLKSLRNWLSEELAEFAGSAEAVRIFEKTLNTDAGMRYFNAQLSRMMDVSGKFSGTIVTLVDLTELKKAGTELARKEQFLEGIFNAIQDGISVLDADLRIIRVNQTMQRIHAHALPLEGKKCFAAYYGHSEPCAKCPSVRAIKSGKLEREEIELHRSDKVWFLEMFAFPMFDDQGRLAGVVDYLRNITARKQAEKVVEEHQRQYRNLFNNHLVPMLLIDPKSAAIMEANQAACRFYGYSHERLTRLYITDINIMDREAVFGEMQRAQEQSRNFFNFRHRIANGEIRDVEVFSGPISFDGRSLLCSIVLDVTDRKALEKERLQKEKLQAVLAMAGAVCHELNQPLTALCGYLDLIRIHLDATSPVGEKFDKAQQQIQRMTDITRRLMNVTQYETRDYPGGLKILDLKKASRDGSITPSSDDNPQE